jgi:hypothetical protein
MRPHMCGMPTVSLLVEESGGHAGTPLAVQHGISDVTDPLPALLDETMQIRRFGQLTNIADQNQETGNGTR